MNKHKETPLFSIDLLVENHSDDVLSITKALTVTINRIDVRFPVVILFLQFYSLISVYYGTPVYEAQSLCTDFVSRERLLWNKLCGEGQTIRYLIIQRMELQIKVIEDVEIEINKKESFSAFSVWN
jgi:hypothetical protein